MRIDDDSFRASNLSEFAQEVMDLHRGIVSEADILARLGSPYAYVTAVLKELAQDGRLTKKEEFALHEVSRLVFAHSAKQPLSEVTSLRIQEILDDLVRSNASRRAVGMVAIAASSRPTAGLLHADFMGAVAGGSKWGTQGAVLVGGGASLLMAIDKLIEGDWDGSGSSGGSSGGSAEPSETTDPPEPPYEDPPPEMP